MPYTYPCSNYFSCSSLFCVDTDFPLVARSFCPLDFWNISRSAGLLLITSFSDLKKSLFHTFISEEWFHWVYNWRLVVFISVLSRLFHCLLVCIISNKKFAIILHSVPSVCNKYILKGVPSQKIILKYKTIKYYFPIIFAKI